MKPLIFSFKDYYINKQDNYLFYLVPKKQFIIINTPFKILDKLSQIDYLASISDSKTINKLERNLIFETKYTKSIFKYLCKEKNILNTKWLISTLHEGLVMRYNYIGKKIKYNQIIKEYQLLENVPLLITKKLISSFKNLDFTKCTQLISFFDNILNYKENINLINEETLYTVLNKMSFTEKRRFIDIIIENNLLPVYIKAKQKIDKIVVELNEKTKKCFIKIKWIDLSRYITTLN